MSNEIFLLSAYLIIWGGLFTYIFYANGQQHKLARRLHDLEEFVSKQEEGK